MAGTLVWLVDSIKTLKDFPEEVRKEVGYALYFAQNGKKHPHAKPFKGLGSGIFEIVEDDISGTYRVVYWVQSNRYLYVLHAFQKKSKRGISTPLKEINLIKQRLKMAKELSQKH